MYFFSFNPLVFLSFNGMNVSNDSYVLASNTGFGDSGLLCRTNRGDCCRSSDHPDGIPQGHWFRPDGREVMSFTQEDTGFPRNFFFRDRSNRIVRLNRHGNPPERGHFRCDIPNAGGVLAHLYVNIGE